LVVFDCKENVILANQAAAKLVGMDLSGLDKSSIREKFFTFKGKGGEQFKAMEEPYYHALNEKEPCEKEGYLSGDSIDRGGFWLRAHASPVLDKKNNLLGVVATYSDISERKRLQQQRDALASVIAHDIKNHLAGEEMIFNYLSKLGENGEKFESAAIDAISKMRASNKHHLELASSLLEIFRADFVINTNNAVILEIEKIIKLVIFLNSLSASVSGVEIKTEIEADLPPIKGVPAAIRHSLHNLLQNAINMSTKGDTIIVSVKKEETGISISVTDHGAGMSEEEISRLFDQNAIASKIPDSLKSSGVGLFFSKLLLDAHHATLTCQSKVGEGSKFTIKLPATI
jgi:PAS domain S-box-containing protein